MKSSIQISIFRLAILCLLTVVFLVGTAAADAAKAKESFNLGVASQKKGDNATAITQYKAAIVADPSFVDAYMNLGSLLFTQQKYPEAAENFKKVTTLAPTNPAGFTNYGKTLYAQKKDAEAMTAFQTAIKLDDNYIDAHKELAKLYFFRLEKPDDAIASLKRYLRGDSTDSYANYLCGMAYKKKKDPRSAITYLKTAAAKDPQNFEALYNLAGIYREDGSFKQAIDFYEQALKVKPKHHIAAYNLAISIESNDPENYDASIAAWERFLRLARNNPNARQLVDQADKHVKELRDAKAAAAKG